ncbi:MAG: hypothetical protein LBK40_02405 [Spirochaetaceae bacterium]|jgi:hypothetical protein|nr:hypothetical protein [Spirochaetaceae bacterium]
MSRRILQFHILGLLISLAVIAGFSAVVLLLWNSLMPDIFGLGTLRYREAAGLLVLSRILFGGIGKGRFVPWKHGGRAFHRDNPLREKWMNMTEEEQRAFVEKERSLHSFCHDRFRPLYESNAGAKTKPGGKEE